jgi:hypothetical protein
VTIPVIDYKNIAGNQPWTGALSFAFEVTRPIKIDALGVFDSSSDGLQNRLYVEIRQITNLGAVTGCTSNAACLFSVAGTTLAAAPVASATFSQLPTVYNLVGGARWQSIPLTTLTTGYWMLTVSGYGPNEQNYNAGGGAAVHVNSLNTFGGAIVWGVGPYQGNAFGTGGFASLPSVWDWYSGGGPVIRYGAGTFSVVPEPGTYALMGTVGLALYLLRRRKTAAKS